MNIFFKFNSKNGFTIIEALVVLFIFSIVTVTFYAAFSIGTKSIIDSKNRLGAISLANERMEIIRNLKYDNIGVVGGIPSGSILPEEDIVENTRSYHIKTFVQYVDDTLDGVYPVDTVSNDYKRVKVTVSWGEGNSKEVFLVSRFVPPGLELLSGQGVLSVNILDSYGKGVPQATVHVINSSVSPKVDITTNTDNQGNLMFPGAKESSKYQINVSKENYESVSTIDPSSVPYSAVDINASVVQGSLNTKSIIIDLLANLNVKSLDYSGDPVPEVGFNIEGGRILGTDNSQRNPITIYNLKTNGKTDSSGQSKLENISPGKYFLSSISSPSGYTFIQEDASSSFQVAPGEAKEVALKFAKNDANSLLVKVLGKNLAPVKNAQVKLSNSSGYSLTQTTSSEGVAFFPSGSEELSSGNYSLLVKATGYKDYNETFEISNLTTKTVNLSK